VLHRRGQHVLLQPGGDVLLANGGDDRLLAFEVAVDLPDLDARLVRDLGDARAVEALILEQPAGDIQQVPSPLFRPRRAVLCCCLVAYDDDAPFALLKLRTGISCPLQV
jgi:hypothetical protein